MSKPELTDMQKQRLVHAAQEAVSLRQQLYLAQIGGAGEGRVFEMATKVTEADARFARMLKTRGIFVGDTVRVIVDGPFKGAEAEVKEIRRSDLRLEVRIDNTTVCPFAHEVELVIARDSASRRKSA